MNYFSTFQGGENEPKLFYMFLCLFFKNIELAF